MFKEVDLKEYNNDKNDKNNNEYKNDKNDDEYKSVEYKTSNVKVYNATKGNKKVVIKIFDYPPYEELNILLKLRPVCGYFLCIDDFGKVKNDINKYFISTEFIQGVTLNDYLRKNYGDTKESHQNLNTIMNNIVKSIEILHKNGISHNDINAENIIIEPSNKIRILDFGESNENKKYFYNDFLQVIRIFSEFIDTSKLLEKLRS